VNTEMRDRQLTTSDRLAGSVWGHLVGDAMGVPYEFRSPAEVGVVRWGEVGTHGQPPGTWSDDGGLMLALLDSLLTVGFDLEDQGRRALAWHDSGAYMAGPAFDVGMTTSRALARLRAGTPAGRAGGAAESDNGNGSLMRILPVAIAGQDLPLSAVLERAALASTLTHRHPRAQVTCAVYCCLASGLLRGEGDLETLLDRSFNETERVADPDWRRELKLLREYPLRTGGGLWSTRSGRPGQPSYRQARIERRSKQPSDLGMTQTRRHAWLAVSPGCSGATKQYPSTGSTECGAPRPSVHSSLAFRAERPDDKLLHNYYR
jgi:hypothetical protein